MAMISRKISGVCAVAGLAFALQAAPALAFDEGRGSTVDTLLGMFGIAPDKPEEPNINYRQRAPLVLPPKTELRQPRAPASARAPNWPQDQEVVAANKRRAAEGKVKLDKIDEGIQGVGARELANGPRSTPGQQAAPRPCVMDTDMSNPNACDKATFWRSLTVTKQEETAQLRPGEEPDRKYLTQPPKGYMKVTKTQRATFEDQTRITDTDSARSFYLNRPKPAE